MRGGGAQPAAELGHPNTPYLYASILPHLHTCSAPSPRPKVHGAAPELDASTRPRRYPRREPPELHTSTSLRLQVTSRAPELYTFVPTRLQACNAPPSLHASIPPRRYAYRAPPELRSPIPLCLHVCTPATRLQRFIYLRLHACSAPSYFQSSMSLRLQIRNASPELSNSIPLSGNTPAACLQSSRTPYLHVSHASRAHIVESARPQRTSRALDSTSISTHLYLASRSSIPLRLHACSAPSEFHSSTRSAPPELHTS